MWPFKRFLNSGQSSRGDYDYSQGYYFPTKGASGSRPTALARTQNWTASLDACLLALLTEEHALGNNVNGTFTTLAWVRIVSEINRRNNLSLTKDQVKNRLKVLKRTFNLYHCLVNKSGWRWDPVLNIPTAGDSSDWDAVIAENSAYAKCRDKSFPPYKDLEFLTEKTTATGRYDFSSVLPPTTTVDSSSSSSPGSSGPQMHDFMQCPPPERSPSPPSTYKNTSGSGHSSAGKRHRSPLPEPSRRTNRPSTGGRRKKTEGISEIVSEMLELGKEKLDIVRNLYKKDEEMRRPIPCIEDCMVRVYGLPGLNDDEVLAAAGALKDPQNRQLFMTMKDDLAYKWVKRQKAKEMKDNFFYRGPFPDTMDASMYPTDCSSSLLAMMLTILDDDDELLMALILLLIVEGYINV